MNDTDSMTQVAPYPHALQGLVGKLRYRPGWEVRVTNIKRPGGCAGLTLSIVSVGYDVHHPDRGERAGTHLFPVPAINYNEQTWKRWLLDRLIDIETHEACEWFRFEESDEAGGEIRIDRPFAPTHGPGQMAYAIRELSRIEDAETNSRGVRFEGSQQ